MKSGSPEGKALSLSLFLSHIHTHTHTHTHTIHCSLFYNSGEEEAYYTTPAGGRKTFLFAHQQPS